MRVTGQRLLLRCLALAALLMILLTFLGQISHVAFHAMDFLAEKEGLNHGLACLFVFSGFLGALVYLHIARTKIRLVLVTYLLTALGMAGLYYLIHASHEGCFTFAGDKTIVTVFDFIYFSFVSVTTLGYGDIVPNHPFVRMLVVGQILFGGYLIFKASGSRLDEAESK
ncbi:MAG: two pore domain potassium channel family protein [Gammaproteobacteria bacterium]|nr:two pore domain potassium channel family protein [Gammaproteobacteria bacterium]